MQLIIYEDSDSTLEIKCYDRNPFAPHYLIGESRLSVTELAEEMTQIQGPITKAIRLLSSHSEHQSDVNPIVYLKLDLHYFDK